MRSLHYRAEQLTALQRDKEYDVLIIGGGVTGCGIALDSRLRGKFRKDVGNCPLYRGCP